MLNKSRVLVDDEIDITVNSLKFDLQGIKNFLRISEEIELWRAFCKTFQIEGPLSF